MPVIIGVQKAVGACTARCRKGKTECVWQPAWYSMNLSIKTVEPTCKLLLSSQCSLSGSKEPGVSDVEA